MRRLFMLGLVLLGCAKQEAAPEPRAEEEARGRRRGACSYVSARALKTLVGREIKAADDDGVTCAVIAADGLILEFSVRHGDVSVVEQMAREGGEPFPALGDQGVVAKGATDTELRAGWVRNGAGVDVFLRSAPGARAMVKALADQIAERL